MLGIKHSGLVNFFNQSVCSTWANNGFAMFKNNQYKNFFAMYKNSKKATFTKRNMFSYLDIDET